MVLFNSLRSIIFMFCKGFLSVYKIDILLDTFYKNDRNC